MDRESGRRLGRYRRNGAGPYENALIDDWLSGEFDRRELIRRASVLGVSVPVLGVLLGAAGEAAPAFAAGARAAASTSRIRVAIIPPPTGAIEPVTFEDQGGLETGGIAGEFLTRATPSRTLLPELAVSWKPNSNATIWTFKLRPNVKFQTGQAMTSADVVATWKALTSPGSQALSAVGSYLAPTGVVAVDDLTVAFHLISPVSNFPYLTSSDTYQAIILPANYKTGTFTTIPQTTGAFMLTNYNPGVGATYERFAGWWGGTAPLAGVDVTYYSAAAAAAAALLGGQIDLIGQIELATDRSLFNNSSVQIFKARGATHREMAMRVDVNNPLKHYQVRQANITLTTETTGEIPELAQIVKQPVKAIGINMTLIIESSTAYFAGTSTGPPKGWGNTPWLNTNLNITDWGSRPVPDVYLVAALSTLSKSGAGVWNAAHYTTRRSTPTSSRSSPRRASRTRTSTQPPCSRSCCTTRRWCSRTSTTTSPPGRNRSRVTSRTRSGRSI
jgi:ABC-type transport system substrate-binding protein